MSYSLMAVVINKYCRGERKNRKTGQWAAGFN